MPTIADILAAKAAGGKKTPEAIAIAKAASEAARLSPPRRPPTTGRDSSQHPQTPAAVRTVTTEDAAAVLIEKAREDRATPEDAAAVAEWLEANLAGTVDAITGRRSVPLAALEELEPEATAFLSRTIRQREQRQAETYGRRVIDAAASLGVAPENLLAGMIAAHQGATGSTSTGSIDDSGADEAADY